MQDQLDAFAKLISPPRFKTYLDMARGDSLLAFELYRWNMDVGSALSWSMHFAEIAVRNGVSSYFLQRFGIGWTDSSTFRNQLEGNEAAALRKAFDRQAVARNPDPPSDDQVVADLSLGFWTGLLRQRYAVPYALPRGLPVIFPETEIPPSFQDIQLRLQGIRQMRNRVAHHEPIIHRGNAALIATRNMAMELIAWTNTQAAEFLREQDPLGPVLGRDPRDKTWAREA